jgi:YVTN family beta-propeller protein
VDTETRAVLHEIKFFTPGGTLAQGEFPYDVAVLSNPDGSAKTAFVTSQRDDQVMVVDLASGNFTSIPVEDQPNRMALSKDQRTLYVVNGNSDTVSVIDTAAEKVLKTIIPVQTGRQIQRFQSQFRCNQFRRRNAVCDFGL